MTKVLEYRRVKNGPYGEYIALAKIRIVDGEITSVYGGTFGHPGDNEGYLHRKAWGDRRSLRTALNFVEYQLPEALDDIRDYLLT